MTETLSKDLAAIVERWRGIARKAAQENADVNSRLQRGETVTITTNIGPCKDLRDQCADELSALLAQHAVAPNEQIFSGAELGDSVKRVAPVADGSSPSKAPSNTAAHMAESSKLTALESQAQSILTNCCQLLDSIKSEWAPENCWSDWDQSIRDAASTWLKDSYAQHAVAEPLGLTWEQLRDVCESPAIQDLLNANDEDYYSAILNALLAAPPPREKFHETIGYETEYMRGRREMREEIANGDAPPPVPSVQERESDEAQSITSPEVFALVQQVLIHHQTAYATFHCTEGRKVIESHNMAIGSASVFLEGWINQRDSAIRATAAKQAREGALEEAAKHFVYLGGNCACGIRLPNVRDNVDKLWIEHLAAAIRALAAQQKKEG